eukprot:11025955-Alexandrium_andersonii.AAC.1
MCIRDSMRAAQVRAARLQSRTSLSVPLTSFARAACGAGALASAQLAWGGTGRVPAMGRLAHRCVRYAGERSRRDEAARHHFSSSPRQPRGAA